MSLLSWERGLKFEYLDADCYGKYVAPLVGAWIEICDTYKIHCLPFVAPLVGAWIEITYDREPQHQ